MTVLIRPRSLRHHRALAHAFGISAALTTMIACSAEDDMPSPTASSCSTHITARFDTADRGASEVVLTEPGRAVRLASGAGYTIYLADYDLSHESLATTVTPPEGNHLATVFITTFNPEGTAQKVAQGQKIEVSDEVGKLTYGVILNDGGIARHENLDSSGTLEVLSLTDDEMCVEVRYRDTQKQVHGTLSAAIADL